MDRPKIGVKLKHYKSFWQKLAEKDEEKPDTKIRHILSVIESSIQADNQSLNTEELPRELDPDELQKHEAELNKKLKESLKDH